MDFCFELYFSSGACLVYFFVCRRTFHDSIAMHTPACICDSAYVYGQRIREGTGNGVDVRLGSRDNVEHVWNTRGDSRKGRF